MRMSNIVEEVGEFFVMGIHIFFQYYFQHRVNFRSNLHCYLDFFRKKGFIVTNWYTVQLILSTLLDTFNSNMDIFLGLHISGMFFTRTFSYWDSFFLVFPMMLVSIYVSNLSDIVSFKLCGPEKTMVCMKVQKEFF